MSALFTQVRDIYSQTGQSQVLDLFQHSSCLCTRLCDRSTLW